MAIRCLSCMNIIDAPVCPHCGYPDHFQNNEHQLPVGTMLQERYQIGKVLGQGGFGITYLAWDTVDNRSVAIKEFYPGGTVYRNCIQSTSVSCITSEMIPNYEYSKERFLREASALAQFRDIPQIVDILDFMQENNTSYIVMEFVRGMDLAVYIQRRGGKLSVDETFRLLKPIMEALAQVHKVGIVHRDISPDNIILDPLGGAKLLDFGAVRSVEKPNTQKGLARSTEAILKHGFAPMEQYNTKGSLGPWTDEYALCATIWYCLTGSIPYEASLRLTEGVDPDWNTIPGLTQEQREALQRGIALRPKDRYPDMDALLHALFPESPAGIIAVTTKKDSKKPKKETAAATETQTEDTKQEKTAVSTDNPPATPRKKRSALIAALAAVLLLAVLGAAVAIPRLPANRYRDAEALMLQGDYEAAAAIFESLEDYEDSAQMAENCRMEAAYLQAEALMGQKLYAEAADLFSTLGSYKDSSEKEESCRMEADYLLAESLMSQGQYAEAEEAFRILGSYKDSSQMAENCRLEAEYLRAEELAAQGEYAQAADVYTSLNDYKDSPEKAENCRMEADYLQAEDLMAQEKYEEAAALYESLGEYKDSPEKAANCRMEVDYLQAEALLNQGQYSSAKEIYESLGDYKDSKEKAEYCRSMITYRQSQTYSQGQTGSSGDIYESLDDYTGLDNYTGLS